MSRLILVAPPLFHGRPQQLIMQQLEAHFHKVLGDRLIVVSPPPLESLPETAGIYDTNEMVRCHAYAYQEVVRLAQDGDRLLFVEGWNPVVPGISNALALSGRRCRFFGILHGAVDVPGDMLEADSFNAKRFESSLSATYSGVFVATKYFHDKLRDWGCAKWVTGLPHPRDCFTAKTKERWVVYNHRWHASKRYEWFDSVCARLPQGWSGMVLTPSRDTFEVLQAHPNIRIGAQYCSSRERYLDMLSRAAVVFSAAKMETFGYGMLEGHLSGAWTVAPKGACYPELPWIDFLYEEDFGSASRAVNDAVYAAESKRPHLSTTGSDDAAGAILRHVWNGV